MARRHRRPPQGTSRIVSERAEIVAAWLGGNLAAGASLMSQDQEFQALIKAKRERDFATVGKLLPVLRERYGDKELERLYKAL